MRGLRRCGGAARGAGAYLLAETGGKQAEKKIKAYADAHKTGSFACVTPVEAERILREFYGLTARAEQSGAPTGDNGGDAGIIDLGAFL